MPTCASLDRLEIIGPDGNVTFYALDPARGLTNVGSHPDNDIVLESAGIAPFQAVIDHRHKPYQLLRLGSDRPAEAPTPLTNWDTLTFEDYTLIYLDGDETAESASAEPPGTSGALPDLPVSPLPAAEGVDAEGATPASAASSAALEPAPVAAPETPPTAPLAQPPSAAAALAGKTPPLALTLAASPDSLAVEPGQTAAFQLTIANPRAEPAEFAVSVTGAAASWVTLPLTAGRLNGGQHAVERVTVCPPRHPDTSPGNSQIAIEISCPGQPEPSEPARVTLTIKPYSEVAVTEIAPRRQKIFWSQASARVEVAATNAGNTEARFDMSGEVEQRLCHIEFQTAKQGPWQPKQAELRLSPGQTQPIAIRLTPLTRLFAGLGPRVHFFTVTVAPQASKRGRRAVLGQLQQYPLFGRAALFLVVLIALGVMPLLFRPAVYEFSATPSQITAGQTATLRWSAAPFSTLRIVPDIGWVTGLNGQQIVSPKHDTVYTLTAENYLSWLNPGLFRTARATAVLVNPVLPRLRLTVDQNTVPAGGLVTLSWQVYDANDLVLEQNGVPEVIPPEQRASGQRQKAIPADTTFTLVAHNEYTPPEGITATVTVHAQGVPATPTAALPVIEKFEVSPAEIFAGEPVRLEWAVSGVDTVTISPDPGTSPPSGAVVLRPQQTTTYSLSATKNGVPVQLVKQVVVKPAPEASPTPAASAIAPAPVINTFTATPAAVAPNSAEALHIQLAWAISGNVTQVEISRPGLPTVPGLSAQGTLEVAANTTTAFTLTAYNGGAVASKTISVQVTFPLPSLTGLSPAAVALGGPAFTLVVNGSGFASTSVVSWNGTSRATTYINSNQLNAAISAADVAQAGSVNVSVVTPAPGGGTSAPLTFAVTNPMPVITSLSPAAAQAGGPAFPLEINGVGFNSQSQVQWNNVLRVVSIASATQLTVLIPASDIAAPGLAEVSVVNAGPGGGTAAAALAVAAPPTAVPTPTPTATVTATATPVATLTATPTPTETPMSPADGQVATAPAP